MSVAATLDAMTEPEARAALTGCCGASAWVTAMLASRPFVDDDALYARAAQVWAGMERADILEAFDHHPRIGADIQALREKFASTAATAASEQAGAQRATEAELERLRAGNVNYEACYGHIFIVCATGKSAAQMAEILESRLRNSPDAELRIAAAEQAKITRLRLQALLTRETLP
ncbi:2-oxo-4-hydroxy-4-carboxy-5-ureidoimidazoline decarboxylase [Enhygromyxa salina]|uniref:2-oxo-4-hydroxy-4-carboxy-5-ureidoimidazoline decarboxylase n=1 Tax=Enhygromyxa salina TaxID=215803 RepID=A0A2S9YKH8_9BACT|nr:2-oxo-4-hydroxy-4-carboxy-5-ureidoimidazoline decarboxylase [Enhygromyxa salina]PRQ05609.1 Uric acid degradation bifunctional protein [Enhygromyxa salina]